MEDIGLYPKNDELHLASYLKDIQAVGTATLLVEKVKVAVCISEP